MQQITPEKIRTAVHKLRINTTPESNRFTAEWYKIYQTELNHIP